MNAPGSRRAPVGPAVRFAIVAAGVGAVSASVITSGYAPRLSSSLSTALGALLLAQGAWVFAAWRLKSALALVGLSLSFVRTYVIQIQSVFYVFTLPLGIGMDVARFMKIRQSLRTSGGGGSVARLLAALGIDRAVGLTAAAGTAIAAVLAGGHAFPSTELSVGQIVGSAFAILIIVSLVGYALRKRLRALAANLVGAIHHPAAAASGTAASVATIAVLSLSLWFAADATDIALPGSMAVLAVSAAFVFQAVPLNVLGLGAGELATAALYRLNGYGGDDIIVLVSLLYAMRLIAAITGGLLEFGDMLFTPNRDSQRHREEERHG